MNDKGDILVVDDSLANLKLLMGVLGRAGYRVRPAPNGRIALNAVRTVPPDMVLLDVYMPEMNGYDVCLALKEMPCMYNIPVIFVSAKRELADRERAEQCGAVDFLLKPFCMDDVVIKVQHHLSRST
ncbi:MAG: response regulator [Chloroflexota bacterium]